MRRAAAVAAAAGLGLGLAAGAVAAVPPARAATKICVALVVDSRSLGGNVSTACTTVASGSTGYDVLAAGGHRLGFRSDGILCTIDGLPREGCPATDGSHYWSYWHRAPGGSSWEYSDAGGGSYQPANKSTEGWVWQNGGATGSTQPANVAYTSICRPSPSPSPSPSPPRAAVRRTTAPAAARPATTTLAPRAAATVAAPTSTATADATARASGSPARSVTGPATAPPPTTATQTPDPEVSLQARSSRGGGPPVAPLVGLAVVVAIAVAAAVRYRRGSRGAG